jgi:AcrR family transcriptional regulator
MVLTRPRRSDVRDAVLTAAGALFLSRGYAATTLSDVAAAAGFTKGAVYSNFGGKPELFAAAVADQFGARATAAVESAVGAGPGVGGSRTDGTSRLARQLTEVVVTDTWSSLTVEFRRLAETDPAVAEAYAGVRRQQQQSLALQLRARATELGLPGDLDTDAVAVLLLTVISGLAVEHRVVPEITTAATIEAAFAALLRGVLR